MIIINQKQQKIITILLTNGAMQSSAVYAELVKMGDDTSLVTIKRTLSEMATQGMVAISGSGRATHYDITNIARIFSNINAKEYCAFEPDKRYGQAGFNFHLLTEMPPHIFADEEMKMLHRATLAYEQRTTDLSATIQKKELERLIIELSWKSSKIEGNTYTLLDTEKLLLENKEAVGHSKQEATMILNHKDAFNFIHDNASLFQELNLANLEKLHHILVQDLNVGFGLRARAVGIVGSKYRPLDNIHQIKEAVHTLTEAIAHMNTPYAKALLALLGISYIQPFEDGNKRTGRLMANALLLAHGCAPLSYRSIDENDYREAMLVFYELNSIIPFRKIFVEQYDFAARNYAVK